MGAPIPTPYRSELERHDAFDTTLERVRELLSGPNKKAPGREPSSTLMKGF
jgi:hypothetical protein